MVNLLWGGASNATWSPDWRAEHSETVAKHRPIDDASVRFNEEARVAHEATLWRDAADFMIPNMSQEELEHLAKQLIEMGIPCDMHPDSDAE